MFSQLSSELRPAASFGAQLRAFRTRAWLTQEALAERAGLGVATLKALERDQRQRPHPSTLALLADALELPPSDRAILVGDAQTAERATPRAPLDVSAPVQVA